MQFIAGNPALESHAAAVADYRAQYGTA